LTDIKKFLEKLFPCWKKSKSNLSRIVASINASLHGKPSRHKFSSYWDDRNPYEWLKHSPNCYELLDWYDGGYSHKPAFYIRLFAFFQVAQWTEIMPPSDGFRKVIAGLDRREKIESFGLGIAVWFFSIMIFVIVCALIPLMFCLGLVSCGMFWPMELKEFVFFGPLEPKQVQVQKNDIVDMEAKVLDMEKSFMEFKNILENSLTEFKNGLSQDQKEILTLLRAVTVTDQPSI
jgi:hypothetical protein